MRTSDPGQHQSKQPDHAVARSIFQRAPRNPLLTVSDLPFRATVVMNPGAAEQDGQTILLLRVEDIEGYSCIHAARSGDGLSGWHIDPKPLLGHGDPEHPYEAWGCEDARVTYVDEEAR